MARLTLIRPGRDRQSFLLTGVEWLIGRNPACAVCIDATDVGERHARIRRNGDDYILTAMAGNGALRVNQALVQLHTLNDGDCVHLGDSVLQFSADNIDGSEAPRPGALRGRLEILNGRHRGRHILLDQPITRFGSAGDMAVMISRRASGYYLSHLEGEALPAINGQCLEDTTQRLSDGDSIHMGQLGFRFTLVPATREATETANPPERQRHCTRVALDVAVTIRCASGEWQSRTIDLSLSGARVRHPAGWRGHRGDRCYLRIQPPRNTAITVDANIRQIEAEQLGVAFVDTDAATSEALRGLMEKNLGDAALLERELSGAG